MRTTWQGSAEAPAGFEGSRIVLGRGGDSPGIDALYVRGYEIVTLTSLPCGHSPYAVGVSPDGVWTAVGTRAGTIHLQGPSHGEGQVLDQGAPILSLCFVNPGEFVASDSRGQCLKWDLGATPPACEVMGEREEVISCLTLVPDYLVGLAVSGGLFLWPLPVGTGVQVLEALPPARPGVLARSMYWQEAGLLAFPAEDGQLALWEMGTEEVQYFPAHEGGFLATAVLNGDLVTVGRHDGCLKRWDADTRDPKHILQAPRGIVSVSVVPELDERLLLIDDLGGASVHALDQDGLSLQYSLDRPDYRVAVAPSSELAKAFLNALQVHEVHRVTARLQGLLVHGTREDLEEDLGRLDQLGFSYLGLEIRAQQAAKTGDIRRELELRAQLAEILPNEPGAVPALDAYGAALERVWLLKEAQEVSGRIHSIDPTGNERTWEAGLAERARTLCDADAVIVPDETVPLEKVIDVFTGLRRPFEGRYLVKRLDCQTCHGVPISPQAFLDKYQSLEEEPSDAPLSRAHGRTLHWIERRGVKDSEAAMFVPDNGPGIAGLEFAIQFRHQVAETFVEPAVLFNACALRGILSFEEHNRKCRDALDLIITGSVAETWLNQVFRYAHQALGRLINAALACQHESAGGDR